MDHTIGTMFSGGGGVDIGAMAAGLQPLWGIEYDDAIAAVARRNLGDHVITADILTVDPATLPRVDVLHASPPCPNFSVAKFGGEEGPNDIALASKVVEFIEDLLPGVFTLENVIAYCNSKSWAMIEDALYGAGYWVHWDHVNAADYGVPQTRKRMIVRAVRGGWVPYPPEPVPWVGWYEAIEDLIPTLPDSQFAPWQLERLPAEIKDSVLFTNGQYDGSIPSAEAHEPSNTITSNSNQLGLRAFLMSNDSHTASGADSHRFGDKPAWTLGTTNGPKMRIALAHGRVVAMTPRCLARFQTFPDWYELPDKKTLAARIIGNAVPPLLYQGIIGPLVESIE